MPKRGRPKKKVARSCSKSRSRSASRSASRSKSPAAKRRKITKKTGAPRKKSGYILFGMSIRPQIKKSCPKYGVTEVVSEIAKRWNKLSEAEKGKWKAKAC